MFGGGPAPAWVANKQKLTATRILPSYLTPFIWTVWKGSCRHRGTPYSIWRTHTHLIAFVDSFSQWGETIPLITIDARTIFDAFMAHWVSRFGIPSTISNDRGWQVEPALLREMAESLGNKLIRTTAYHPQANGLVERFQRTLKTTLRVADNLPWAKFLPQYGPTRHSFCI